MDEVIVKAFTTKKRSLSIPSDCVSISLCHISSRRNHSSTFQSEVTVPTTPVIADDVNIGITINHISNHLSTVSETNLSYFENSFELNLFTDERIGGEVNSNLKTKKVKLHVFQGGEFGYQSTNFIIALAKFQNSGQFSFETEYITCKVIKEKRWTIRDLMDWLIDCDIHFILTHIHQGITQLNWNMTDLYQSLLRLQAHRGFPNGLQLECPMFTQDKYEYLRVLMPVKLANPTMKIKFNSTGNFSYLLNDIQSQHEEKPGLGFVLKNPYATNSTPWFPKTVEQIMHTLIILNSKYYGKIPYTMLQPCMASRKEYKVISFNGKAKYISAKKGTGKSYTKKPHGRLFEFVDTVLDLLQAQCPAAIVSDCIVRVDVFQNIAGNLVVNELESLEACYETTNVSNNSIVDAGMQLFFETELAKYLEIK